MESWTEYFLAIAVFVALAATLGVLLFGVYHMARQSKFSRRWDNVFMRWRIGLQLLAVLLIGLFFLLYGNFPETGLIPP